LKLIYLIAVHYAPVRYRELLDALGPAVIITHVDKTTDDDLFKKAAANHPEVYFVPETERIDVIWGGWSQVAATLSMLAVAQPFIEPDDYIILISGDTYPTQLPKSIENFFNEGRDAQYINTVSMPSRSQSKPISRIAHAYLEYDPRNGKKNIARRIFNRVGIPRNYVKALAGRRPRAGSTWWALTGEAVLWMMRNIADDPRFVEFCHYTKMPDEFFFQTLMGASPFASRVRPGVMFADWSRPTGPKPAIIDDEHIRTLSKQLLTFRTHDEDSVALFVRKVDEDRTSAQIRKELWTLKITDTTI
jgi:hypothetical protein